MPSIRTLLSAACPLLCLLLAASPAPGQAPPPATDTPLPGEEIRVILEGQQRSAFRLAMPAAARTSDLGAELAAAASELEQTLRDDLEQSRVFLLQGPTQLAVLELTGEQSRDFELYRSLGNELLLQADFARDGARLVIEVRVFELKSGRALLGKRYRGAASAARRIAHTLSDELVLFFSGRRGVALTSIAFTSDRSGFKELFLMDYDGANQRAITAHKSISLSPDWSPDGREIAYVSYFSGAPRIYRVDLASGRKRPAVVDGDLNISPTWSPDGTRIAFARTVGGGNSEIFVSDIDGVQMTRLTHAGGIDSNPAWSPTGREIAFTSDRAGSPQIYTMDAEGANLRRITFEGDYNDGAAWSPDGTRLVYSTRRGGPFLIATSDMVTLESRVLTGGPGSQESPSFSPDGRKIAFAWRGQIWVMDADGGNTRQLTREGTNLLPAWSGFPP